LEQLALMREVREIRWTDEDHPWEDPEIQEIIDSL
jgi:hypothetical protein